VRRGLPSGKNRALGKETLCRAPNPALGKGRFAECLTLGKLRYSAKKFFAECRALGKHGHSAKSARGQTTSMAVTFAECRPLGTRQRAARGRLRGHQAGSPLPSATWSARVPALALGKKYFFLVLAANFFVKHSYSTMINMFKFGTFLVHFTIFFTLFRFVDFFRKM